jgi:alanyl-tRNA synthetase
VEALAAEPGTLVDRHLEGKDAGFLQRAARQLAEAAPGKTALLTATQGGASFFVLSAGLEAKTDVPALGREVAALLDAKGGGSGRVFQGKAGSLAGRTAAVARLRGCLG